MAGSMDVQSDPNLERLLSRIVPALQPEAVYLFGSRARGTNRPDSDYDLLVVMPDDTPAEKLNMLTAFQLTRGLGVAVEVVPCRRSIFERKKLVPGTLSRTVWEEGCLLHGH